MNPFDLKGRGALVTGGNGGIGLGMALGLAVNARGADHNRSGAYEADLSGDYDRLAGGDAQVAAAVATEDRAAVMDSMILCKFLRGVFDEPYREWAELLRVVTGWDVDADELRATARRIVLVKRMFNLREGWIPTDDWLPSRLLREPVRLGSGRDATLTPARLREIDADAGGLEQLLSPPAHEWMLVPPGVWIAIAVALVVLHKS